MCQMPRITASGCICQQWVGEFDLLTSVYRGSVCAIDSNTAKCIVLSVSFPQEANDLALRLARAYTGSSNTIVVDGAYHGHTLGVLEVSPYKYEHSKEFHLTPQGNGAYKTPGKHIWKVPCPDVYRGPHRGATAGSDYAAYVKEACDHYCSIGESVGAFIMEGGMSVG